MDLDFTLRKYQEFCEILQKELYTICTVYDYLTKYQYLNIERSIGFERIEDVILPDQTAESTNTLQKSRIAILRHDVDRKIGNALRMAQLEHELDISSSYYFRYPYTFKPEIIREIYDLGHEVGYHYETFSKAKGDPEKAIKFFEEELEKFRDIYDVKTICMHGSPLSKYDNRDIWKYYNFYDFKIYGEAYLSIRDVQYFTDTGRNWNGMNSIKDHLVGAIRSESIDNLNSTNALINYILGNNDNCRFYFTVHPERWNNDYFNWFSSLMIDFNFTIGKKILVRVR